MCGARPHSAAPLILATLAVGSSAHADDGEASQEWNAAAAAESGNFLPYSESPSTSAPYVTTFGGYDTVRGGVQVIGELQLRLHRRVYLLAAGTYEGPIDHTFQPEMLAQVIVVEEAQAGVDVALFGGWEHAGFVGRQDVLGRIAIAGHFQGAYLLGGGAFGAGSGQRYGEVTLGAIREVRPKLYLGVDTRGRREFLLADAWDLRAGPVASYASGMFSVSATAGLSVLREPRMSTDKVGAITMLGVGAVF